MNNFLNVYFNLIQQIISFVYNECSEVVSATLGTNEYTYSYDPIGNRTTSTQNAEAKSYISNPLNQYITIQQEEQTAAPTYDADGNMLSSPSGWSFTWNAENRLVSASRGGAVVHYTYDAFGRMISKQIIGAENKTITYIWDVFNIIKEIENSIATYNIWGLDIDGTMQGAGGVGGLLAVAKSGNFYTPTYDANGNVTEYVSVNGNIVAQYQYSAFGEIISQSGLSFTHRFSTKPYCPTTGLIEYQFRKYDPVLGRWLSRDPIEEAGGLNLYAFCGNNALIIYDYLGFDIIYIGGAMEKTLNQLNNFGEEVGANYKFPWDAHSEIVNKIKEILNQNPCEPIVLVGHSYGGDTALDVAEMLLNITNINLFIVTIDPVSQFDLDTWFFQNHRTENIKEWINVYQKKGVEDYVFEIPVAGNILGGIWSLIGTLGNNNMVASGGGQWNFEKYADYNILMVDQNDNCIDHQLVNESMQIKFETKYGNILTLKEYIGDVLNKEQCPSK